LRSIRFFRLIQFIPNYFSFLKFSYGSFSFLQIFSDYFSFLQIFSVSQAPVVRARFAQRAKEAQVCSVFFRFFQFHSSLFNFLRIFQVSSVESKHYKESIFFEYIVSLYFLYIFIKYQKN
jgi:hypothetical protein